SEADTAGNRPGCNPPPDKPRPDRAGRPATRFSAGPMWVIPWWSWYLFSLRNPEETSALHKLLSRLEVRKRLAGGSSDRMTGYFGLRNHKGWLAQEPDA